MPKRKRNPHPPRGPDGLTELEAAFVRHRRADRVASNGEIAKRAGYEGSEHKLRTVAAELLRRPRVSDAIYAPSRPDDLPPPDEYELKEEIRRFWLITMRSPEAPMADRVRSADKLMSTIPGGYVPVTMEIGGKLSLEHLVRSMGGAPQDQDRNDQPALPAPTQEEAKA